MKRCKSVLLKALAFGLCLVMLLLGACGDSNPKGDGASTASKADTASKAEGEQNYERIKVEHKSAPILRMLVISDTHNKNDKLSKAIASTWKYAQSQEYKGFDAIVIVGDLTDNGTDARPSRRNRSEEEIEAKENEAILQDVFGGSEELAAQYTVQKSVSYGRSRITLLRPVAGEA